MFGWYIDPVYFWYVFIPTILISVGVQIYLRSTFSKWSRVKNSAGIVGPQIAGYFKDAAKGGEVTAWIAPFVIAACACFVSAVLTACITHPKHKTT